MIGIEETTGLQRVDGTPVPDTTLDDTSTNSVQNKVVTEAINEISEQPVNLLLSDVSTTDVVTLNGSMADYRTLIFIAYQPNANDYRTFTIPTNYFLADNTKRFTVYSNDSSSRIMLISSVSNTSIEILYIAGNVVLKAVYGIK